MTDTDDAAFSELLARLQPLIGETLLIEFGKRDRFFGLKLEVVLQRVETLPESQSVVAWFSNDLTIDLAPGEQTISVLENGLMVVIDNDLVLDLVKVPSD